jgi:hypothetical protein
MVTATENEWNEKFRPSESFTSATVATQTFPYASFGKTKSRRFVTPLQALCSLSRAYGARGSIHSNFTS